MKRIVSNLKAHLLNWRQWELNPVVVKELRQAVRSWAVTGTLLLFLIVLFCSAVGFFITQSFEITANQRLGATIFSTFTVILTGASLLFIPLYIGVRVAAERQDSNFDLLYISTLTPQRIIRGKFFCGAYVTLLFFSACMPFMAFTNLLRGVDLPSVFFVLLCLFLVVCCAVQVAIFLACLPISKILKILVALFAIISSFWMMAGLTFVSFEMMQRGIGSMMSDRDFWAVFLTASGVILSGALLFYYLSVGLISPQSANRALPIRIYLTVIWMLGGVLSLIWAGKQHDAARMLPWAVVSFIVLGVSLVVVVSNQDTLSIRVRRTIPKRFFARAAAFLFYNGAAGGLVWLALVLGTTYAVIWVILSFGHFSMSMSPDEAKSFLWSSAAAILYMFDYALSGLIVHRKFLSRRPARWAGVLTVFIPAAWALIPAIVLFFLNHLSATALERSQMGNVFNVFTVALDTQKETHLAFAAAWLIVMLALNAKWFARQVVSFTPYQRPAPAPAATEVPPVIPAAIG